MMHYGAFMSVRTTVTIASDVHAEIERLQREEGLRMSEALNLLARRGIAAKGVGRVDYVHQASPLGLRIDVTNIGETLDLLDQED